MGDADALASAMSKMLDHPTSRVLLEEACRPYCAAYSAARYLEIMLRDPARAIGS